MALSEIEKLERRYTENPQGLTFAPLAEVHRKTGEVQRALDLLGPGLQIHPDYIPASIVLGRCHMDLGDVQAAETAFLHVLALDGENVIALKALAEISERLFKFDDAERWLNTLLTVDRSNDDAREQLQRVEISRRQAGAASSAEPSTVTQAEAAKADGPTAAVAPEVPAVVDVAAPLPPPPFEPPVAEPAVGWVSQSGQGGDAPHLGLEDLEPSALREDFEPSALRDDFEPSALRDDIEEPRSMGFDEPVGPEDSVAPLAGLVGRDVDTPDDRGDDFRVETSEDIILQSAGGSEFQMPDASQELFSSSGRGERAPFEEDAPAPPSPAWAPPASEPTPPPVPEPEFIESKQSAAAPEADAPAAEAPAAEAPAAEAPAAVPAPEPVMPEPDFVYQPPAPDFVYQPPSPPAEPLPSFASVPSEFRFHRRDEDRGEAAPPAAEPSAPPTKRSYGVSETGGRSVVQLFKVILTSRPPAQAAPAAVRQQSSGDRAGAPTRPAADSLSLSSVFGEEPSGTHPAGPTPNSGAGSVSFDDFFGSSSASPAARTPRAPDPKNDDLDQFHTWLQNLKR